MQSNPILQLSYHSFFCTLSQELVVRENHISQEINTLGVFCDEDFLGVQFKSQCFTQKLLDNRHQRLQVISVFRYHDEVVSVSGIVFYAQFLFHKLIKLVHVYIGKKLGCEVPNWYSFPREEVRLATNESFNDFFKKPQCVGICNLYLKHCSQNSVVNSVKKLFDIAFKCVAMSRVVGAFLTEHFRNAVYTLMCSFSYSAREGCWNESRLENPIQDFKNSVMKNTIANGRFVNITKLRIADTEANIVAMSIRFVPKLPMQLKDVLFEVFLKFKHVNFLAFTSLELVPRAKEVFGINYLIKKVFVNLHRQ